ncbi:hypothetical protein QYF36_023507 [Acer negundo]|nr:hypothetical protein QYF36_023507 [Acer negundo]
MVACFHPFPNNEISDSVENAAAQRFLWNEGELANIFVSDYRSIVVPLLKSFLEPHLQDLFYKDAEEKSEAAAKALLAEVEAETKNNNKGSLKKHYGLLLSTDAMDETTTS